MKNYIPLIVIFALAVILFFVGKRNAKTLNT